MLPLKINVPVPLPAVPICRIEAVVPAPSRVIFPLITNVPPDPTDQFWVTPPALVPVVTLALMVLVPLLWPIVEMPTGAVAPEPRMAMLFVPEMVHPPVPVVKESPAIAWFCVRAG